MSGVAPTFAAVLRALELRDVRLPAGPGVRGPVFAFGGADGELRGEAWADCPVCNRYGLRVERRDDGTARLGCQNGCRSPSIIEALAQVAIERSRAA